MVKRSISFSFILDIMLFKVAIFLLLSINLTRAALPEDLVELSCISVQQCRQFEQSGVNVTCVDGLCRCRNATVAVASSNSTAAQLRCVPPNLKQSNIIGGHCPCVLSHAECNNEENICYCAEHYRASEDKRRCIREMVSLNEECEMDMQCQAADKYAICNKAQRCTCRAEFVPHFGKCLSVALPDVVCGNDSDCLSAHMTCALAAKKCVCTDRYLRAVNKFECLPVLSFGESCTDHLQCQKNLGPGGSCINGHCHCSDKHYVLHKDVEPSGSDTQLTAKNTVCESITKIGEYCRQNSDCYRHNLPLQNQTMDCIFGECNCKSGYYSINGQECVQSSRGNLMASSFLTHAMLFLASFKIISLDL